MDSSQILSGDKNGKLNPLLRSVFDKLDIAVVIANLKREIVMVNAAAETLFQYQEQELWGQKTQVLYASKDDFEEQGRQRYNANATDPSLYTITYAKKNGDTFEGETQGGPIHDEHGNLIYFVGLIKDVSTQLSAERTLNRLHSITSDQTRSFTERVDAILALGAEHFGLPIAILSQIEDTTYTVIRALHPDNALRPGMTFELGATYCSHVFKANDVQGFHHVAESRINSHPCYQNFGLEAYLGSPIFVTGERYGTLNFSSPTETRPFTGQDIELVRLFADWIGSEILRQRQLDSLTLARKEMERIAATDPLTGLGNRRMMEQSLKKEVARAHRHGTEFSIAIIDFDHFKRINDRFGHKTGDDALRAFAKIVKQEARNEDLFARWGGEEFIAGLPCTDSKEAVTIMDRLAVQLREVILTKEPDAPTLTISVGVAQLQADESITSLLSRADDAMYLAKSSGRDHIVIHS